MPLILRGVTVRGIESIQTKMGRRERAWAELAKLIDQEQLSNVFRTEPLERVIEIGQKVLSGTIQGRIVIDVNA